MLHDRRQFSSLIGDIYCYLSGYNFLLVMGQLPYLTGGLFYSMGILDKLPAVEETSLAQILELSHVVCNGHVQGGFLRRKRRSCR
jgi:hypothetical protein